VSKGDTDWMKCQGESTCVEGGVHEIKLRWRRGVCHYKDTLKYFLLGVPFKRPRDKTVSTMERGEGQSEYFQRGRLFREADDIG